MAERYHNRIELLQGTLDMIILQTLRWGPQHGYAISQAIRSGSGDVLQVETGSLYPALHRLEKRGCDDRHCRADESEREQSMKLPWSRHEEIDEEVRAHLQMAIQDRIGRGESAEEAEGASVIDCW